LFRKTPLKAQNDYIFYKFGGGIAPLALPWLRLCFGPPLGNFLRTTLTVLFLWKVVSIGNDNSLLFSKPFVKFWHPNSFIFHHEISKRHEDCFDKWKEFALHPQVHQTNEKKMKDLRGRKIHGDKFFRVQLM